MIRHEDAIQKEVADWLTDNMPLASWWTATANGAVLAGSKAKRAMQSKRLKATGVKNGAPDLIFCHDGRFLSIELKVPKTATTAKTYQDKEQKKVEDAITLSGGGYAVCRSVTEVAQQLMAWGVPIKGSLRQQLIASITES